MYFYCLYNGVRCGCAEGLEAGRHCLKKWGFRRSEDICWIKTNNEHPGGRKYLSAVHQESNSVLTHTKVWKRRLGGEEGEGKEWRGRREDIEPVVPVFGPLPLSCSPSIVYTVLHFSCNVTLFKCMNVSAGALLDGN
jgi:hypothetical protein